MDKCVVSLELPSDLILSAHDLAAENQGTVSNVFQDLLEAHLQTKNSGSKEKTEKGDRLIMAAQKLLFRDLAHARDWDDLRDRLARHGYFLKVSLGGMSLHTETSGQKVCNLHELGFSYGQFVRRFGPDCTIKPEIVRA